MPTDSKPKCVRDLRGPKADVLAKLATEYDLAPELSAFLTAKVEQSPHAGVTVHAHEQGDANNFHLAISITKLFAWLLLLSAFCFPLSAFGALTSSNMVTYAATGGASTNTGSTVYLGTAYISATPSFIVSDGGTTTTNAMTVRLKYGIGTNTANFNTVATYTKTATNAAEGVISPGMVRLDIYAMTEVVTTNNVTVGTKAILTQ